MSVLGFGHLADIIKSLPLPKPTDPVRVDVGGEALAYLRSSSFSRPPGPCETLPPYGVMFGIPVVLNEALDPRMVRVVSRGGEVTHEWEMPPWG